MAKNKKGWMRILEATIAVLLVSGVLITVYSNQAGLSNSAQEYFYSLERQILSDISLRSDYRLLAINADDDADSQTPNPNGNYTELDSLVQDYIPDFVGYYLAVCRLDDDEDFCKMTRDAIAESVDKDVYVEDIIISSDLGTGNNAQYDPTKVRLYMWEK